MTGIRNKEIVRFRKDPVFCFGIHSFLLILFTAFLAGIESVLTSERRLLLFVVAMMGLILIILSIIYSCFLDWNSWIYIDREKIQTRIRGKKYQWKWSDIIKVDCIERNISGGGTFTIGPSNQNILIFTTSTSVKQCKIIVRTYSVYEKILRYAPQEQKEMIQNVLIYEY